MPSIQAYTLFTLFFLIFSYGILYVNDLISTSNYKKLFTLKSYKYENQD